MTLNISTKLRIIIVDSCRGMIDKDTERDGCRSNNVSRVPPCHKQRVNSINGGLELLLRLPRAAIAERGDPSNTGS